MESIALGTPVIGSRIGGIPELIEEGGTGDLVGAGDAEELKNKEERLWNGPPFPKKPLLSRPSPKLTGPHTSSIPCVAGQQTLYL